MVRLALFLLAGAAFAAAPTTLRLARGDSRGVPLPRPNADVRHDCPTSVATVARNAAGTGLDVVGRNPGSCTLTIDGAQQGVEVYDAREADAATCAEVRERLRGSGLVVDCKPGVVSVRGTPVDEAWEHVVERLAAMLPGVYPKLTPRPTPEVEYTLSFLELRRTRGHDVGIDTPAAIASLVGEGLSRLDGGQAASIGMFGPLADQISAESVLSKFEVLEIRTGRTQLGQASRIHDGGSLQKEVRGVETASLVKIDYGFFCDVTVDRHALGYEVDVDVTVREEIPGGSGDTLRFAERSTASVVNVGDGETIVIATGNSNRSWSRDHGLIGLHRIPGLGLLFGQDERSLSPTVSAVLLTVSEPGAHPEWLERLEELRARLGATWD